MRLLRRVQLVRGKGRDVSGQYVREGGGEGAEDREEEERAAVRGEVWDKVVLVHEAQRLRQPRPDKVRKVHVANAWFPCSPRAARDVSPRAPSDAGAALTWHRQGGLRPKVMSRTSVVLSASDTSTAASTWRGGTRHVQLVRREGRDVSSLYRREWGGRV